MDFLRLVPFFFLKFYAYQEDLLVSRPLWSQSAIYLIADFVKQLIFSEKQIVDIKNFQTINNIIGGAWCGSFLPYQYSLPGITGNSAVLVHGIHSNRKVAPKLVTGEIMGTGKRSRVSNFQVCQILRFGCLLHFSFTLWKRKRKIH